MASEARAKIATSNGARNSVLAHIREALATPPHRQPDMTPIPTSSIYAPVTEPVNRFVQEATANLMEVLRPADQAASALALVEVIAALPAGEVHLEDTPALRTLASSLPATRAMRWSTEGRPSEDAQATVTTVEALVAQTGSLLVSSANAGRGATIIAPVHVVYAMTAQIIPDLETALQYVHERELYNKASFVGLISGSSRTADIEKILVQGAHGPRRLVLILQNA